MGDKQKPKPVKLLGRTHQMLPLRHIGAYPSYHEAVRVGQRNFGHGNFSVETPGRVPSCEEQLLQTSECDRRRNVLKFL
jgi:hypothetical protein